MFITSRPARTTRFAPSVDALDGRIAPSGGLTTTIDLPPDEPGYNLAELIQVEAEEYYILAVDYDVEIQG